MKAIRMAGVVAGLLALFVGLWGLVTHNGVEVTAGELRSAVLWISIGIIATAVASTAALFTRQP